MLRHSSGDYENISPGIHRVLLFLLSQATVPAQPAPRLQIQADGNSGVRITFPAGGVYQLQQATFLPLNAWLPVTQVSTVSGQQLEVRLPVSGPMPFFRLATPPWVSIVSSSPVDGEQGVAVTRETIVGFSAPLASDTVIRTNNFYATFAGRRILSRAELSSDRARATLFYLEPLPGSATINVSFNAQGLTDSFGRPLDPAGTGQTNGLKLIQFDTLSLTPLTGTAVIGTVYASELVPGSDTGTNAVNKPLGGVTVTVDGMEETLRAVTDKLGNFTLSPVPPGRFFVHIDGRTVVDAAAGIHYPDQSYYPNVGKAWAADAGKTNNLAGGTGTIYCTLFRRAGNLDP